MKDWYNGQGVNAPASATRKQPVPRRGLSRVESAVYVGVSPSLFDEMVKDGRMPMPRIINVRVVWDLWELDEAFSSLPHKGGETICNPWDDETQT